MRIVIAGGTGLIGRALTHSLIVVAAIRFLIENKTAAGRFNLTARMAFCLS